MDLISCVFLLLIHLVVVAASYNEGPPVIEKQPSSSVVVERGEPVVLPCTASGNARITWFRDGEDLTQNPRPHRIQLDPGSLFFLKVKATKRESDAGTYWCVATNSYGATHSRNATLTVVFLANDFQVISEPLVRARVGDTVRLPCRPPRGVPRPEIKWLRNGGVMNNSSRITVAEEGDLVIRQAVHDDTAQYACQATNVAGTRHSRTTTLSITNMAFAVEETPDRPQATRNTSDSPLPPTLSRPSTEPSSPGTSSPSGSVTHSSVASRPSSSRSSSSSRTPASSSAATGEGVAMAPQVVHIYEEIRDVLSELVNHQRTAATRQEELKNAALMAVEAQNNIAASIRQLAEALRRNNS